MDSLKYKGYSGSVEYSEEDHCLVGRVLDMPKTLILYEGSTIEELEADFREGLEFYFETCKEQGVVPKKPLKSANVSINIPLETQNRIAAFAKNSGISVNAFIRDSIERRLEAMV